MPRLLLVAFFILVALLAGGAFWLSQSSEAEAIQASATSVAMNLGHAPDLGGGVPGWPLSIMEDGAGEPGAGA